MGSCDGFQVEGFLRKAATGKRQILLELKPSSSLCEELCSFCDEKCEQMPSPHSNSFIQHSHSIEGIFSISQNQLIFTLKECTSIECAAVDNAFQPIKTGNNAKEQVLNTISQTAKKIPEALQYQVDGKAYEIKANSKDKKPMQLKTKKACTSLLHSPKLPLTNNSIEYVIENEKFTSTSLTQQQLEEFSSESQNSKISNFETSLKLLQVKLKENGVIPEQIICGPDTSTFLQNMRELAKLVAPNGQNIFQCAQCEDEMTSYFPYIEHIFKHFGSRPYICSVCQASFQTRAVMRHHLDMHGGKAPFECEFCGKKFRNSCHMKQHRMRHTGERPHNCPYCEKSFAHKNVLKIHLQVHTGEKPCCCDLCGKLFRERHRLACHLATHYKSEKSLECANCGKSFKTVGMLKVHEAKKCSSKTIPSADLSLDDTNLDSLQNVSYDEALNDANLLNTDHEVTIIEAETLEVLPVNTYIVEPSSVGAMLVQFSIDQDDTQEIASLQNS